MFCPECGQQLPDGTKFCTRCGKPTSPPIASSLTIEPTSAVPEAPAPKAPPSLQPASADVSGAAFPKQSAIPPPPAPPMNVSTVQPKRGGRLALGAFVVAIAMGALLGVKNTYVAALLVGGATIALLLYWRKNGSPIKGKVWAWTVGVFLILAGFGGIIQKRSTPAASSSSSVTPPTTRSSTTPSAALSLPADQQAFINAVQNAQATYKSQPNEMAKGGVLAIGSTEPLAGVGNAEVFQNCRRPRCLWSGRKGRGPELML